MPFSHLYVFFGKMSTQFFCPFVDSVFFLFLFLFLILSCISYLYILDINPLSVISFANIFSHSIDCVFILSVVSFAVKKLLSLISSHLFVFAFISFALGDRSNSYCYDLCQGVFHLCYLLGVSWFQVLHLDQ